MTKTLVSAFALATILALPAAASNAPRAQQRLDRMEPYASGQYVAPNSNVVTFGNRIVGQDPDPNIRTQILHDPVPSEY